MKSLISALSVVFLLILFGCKEELKVYRVGAVIPLSGQFEAYGRNVKNGLTLALEEINASGGVKGKTLDILFEDDRSDEKVAAGKAKALADNVPVIIGGVTSNEALAMAPICEKAKVVLLSPTASSPKLTGIGQYFFRNYPSDTLEGSVMAEYAVRRMKIRTVAILYIDKEYGKGITDVFKERFQGLGGVVTYEKGYPEGTLDFVDDVKQVRASPPDAVYLPGYFTEVAAILKELKAQKVEAKVISTQGMAQPMIVEIAGDAAEGVVYPQPPFDPEAKNMEIQKYVAAYKKKFPTKPDVDAAFSYDALRLVAKAIENCVNYPQDLRARIADTNFHGITGDIAFGANGDVDIQPRMFEIKGGQFVPIR